MTVTQSSAPRFNTSSMMPVLKRGAELCVTVMDQILPGSQEAPLFHRHVADHLDHPRLIGMRRHAGSMDSPTAQVEEKQHVVCHEPAQCPDLGGEEVRGHEDIHVRPDELFPRGGGLTLWRWWNAMPLQDVAHRLITDGGPEVGQGTDDPVIAPGAILLRQTHH